jgi:type I restriction enzyme S subunit
MKNAIGTGVKHLRVGDVENLIIPICSPQEQIQIVQEIETRLSVCDKLNESIDQSLEKAQALRQSILKKAFEGKLLSQDELQNCRQQPDWEPAAKLLERVKSKKSK